MALIKALAVGDSGNGKTGALASLALAGYNLHIVDFDVKMNSANILQSELEPHPEAWARVRYRTLSDTITFLNGKPILKPPCLAYKSFGRTLSEWGLENFNSSDVLVIDTLTSMAEAAFHEACALAGKLGRDPSGSDHPRPAEYGWMADSLKLAMEFINSDSILCHVIVNAHVKITATEEESLTVSRDKMGHNTEAFTKAIGLPNARGQEIPRIVARYFNNVFLYTRQGPNRIISTQPTAVLDTKTSKIRGIKRFYPIETGLRDLFKDLDADPPQKAPREPQPAPVVQTETEKEMENAP